MFAIDLRSDTFTRPTKAMRDAMYRAEVGDDVFGEDPTVNALQEKAAKMTGKQAALFVPSGSMANLVSILAHAQRGQEILLGDQSHIFYYEQGSSAAVAGVHPRTIKNNPDGTIDLNAIKDSIRLEDDHFPQTCLLALENTHNRCKGTPLSRDYMQAVGQLTQSHGLKLHIDGARIFNASIALGVSVAELARTADSLNFCLSKGLGCPVGSLVCGSQDFIKRAKRARKLVGGGMRQAGIIAAAGIVALDDMVERLAEDHRLAKKLACGLAETSGLVMDPAMTQTNIVYFEVQDPLFAEDLVRKLHAQSIGVLQTGQRQIRAVLHYHISENDIDQVLRCIKDLLA